MSNLVAEATSFVHSYAALFASPDASSPDHVGALCEKIGRHYRPGMTMFTNGQISRFDTQRDAAQLIEKEMRNNISTGLGTKLLLRSIDKIEPYSETSAICWLKWTFEPMEGSEFEGKGWTFVNVYGFRKEKEDEGEGKGGRGWEWVVRDQEVDEVRRVTGGTFE
ncbi:uncharacterized protein LTR77_002540 [Saxophila tyrrhenica]|uniref:SnoaL-like domain-containing protein n=1 Tax=Saxophila tyrrhenica TaxID=1690608 RepID=A0AAV9PJT3_9PEZI|nr:hypothetical protein LTR77_002540 [Saxophila tyrrhenica]